MALGDQPAAPAGDAAVIGLGARSGEPSTLEKLEAIEVPVTGDLPGVCHLRRIPDDEVGEQRDDRGGAGRGKPPDELTPGNSASYELPVYRNHAG